MRRAGINFQTLPKELRKLFVADKGWDYLQFDMSQIEARIVACYLPNPKLYEFFQSGQDVHSLVAGEIFGVNINELTKASPERAKAKSCVHGANYGLNAPKFGRMVGLPVNKAATILNAYLSMFGVKEWWLEIVKELKENNQSLTTIYGRKGRFYGSWKESKTSFDWLTQNKMLAEAYSFKPQSTNADFTKERLVFVLDKVDHEKFIPLINLHDEWVILCKSSYSEEAAKIITREVARPITINGREISVPCSIKISSVWE